MKYFVCIIPPQPVFGELSKIINDLSVENQSPIFFPHLTVLGNVDRELSDIKKAVETVAKNIESFYLSLGQVSFGTTYFQSVLVKVELSAQISNLNLELKKLLNMDDNVFTPHISLMYGNQSIETRENIAKKTIIQSKGFDVAGLAIVPDKPNPEEWEPIANISFGKVAPGTLID